MDLKLLDWREVATWAISEFRISAVTASAVLVVRMLWRRNRPPQVRFLPGIYSRSSHAASGWATTLPVLVWALEANSLSQVVQATHASVDPNLLLASMQLFLGGLLVLALILLLDVLGRAIYSPQPSAPSGTNVPLIILLALGAVVADWLLSQVGWWALIHRASASAAP